MEVALKLYTVEEIDYLECDVDLIIINNRIACSFDMDVNKSFEFAKLLPADCIKVSEGGIYTPEKAKELSDVGFQGIIIGDLFMKTANPGYALG